MRDPDLQQLFDAVHLGITAKSAPDSPARALSERIFTALRDQPGDPGDPEKGNDPAICHHLSPALVKTATASSEMAAVAHTFSRLAPKLRWAPRPAGDSDEADFQDNHANTTIVGIDGLEERRDVRIGASLVAPNIRYPDHSHPPEEVYLVLSGGQWWNSETPWHEPGPGGIVHNPPGIMHAMRAGEAPLLAIWCLWNSA